MRIRPMAFGMLAASVWSMSAFADQPELRASFSASGSIEAGQVVSGWDRRATNLHVDHVWMQRAYLQLTLKGELGDHAAAFLGGEDMVTYSWTKQQEKYPTLKPECTFYPHHVEGQYWVGNKDQPLLFFGAGIFPFKYNPDVKNLGEYLYRTGTYPGYLINEFDFPMNRLMGLRMAGNPLSWIKLTGMLTSEPYQLPLLDWGVSGLVDCNIGKVLNIGAGVFFSHLLSINKNYTTPKTFDNIIQDTANPADTSYYTFRGTKVMARFSFDPKPFFNTRLFGEDDLRLYAEAAVIGVKDYPVYYDTLWQRVPVMVGFNCPFPLNFLTRQLWNFALIDMFSLEVEWYGSRYPDSYYRVWTLNNIPQPYQDPATVGVIDYRKDDWKWSVYAKKKLGLFTFAGQIANDHVRLVRHDDEAADREEALRTPKDWEWMLKCGFGF